ncbi:MAG: hypothetical protein M0003_09370 [Acidithiobacillus sp.]|nr:hypothetical protein [Acidithiobacillus sp.]
MEQTGFGMSIMSLMRHRHSIDIIPEDRAVIIDVGESHRACREVSAQRNVTSLFHHRSAMGNTRNEEVKG